MPDSLPLASLPGNRAGHWRPGPVASRHGEVFASGHEGSGAALALALALDQAGAAAAGSLATASDERAWLWVQDAAAIRLTGRPFRPGLPARLRHRLIHVAARTPQEALFALEEGVRCRDMAFVVGEIAGNPKALDFTASRRLSLAAERHGVPLWLVRVDACRDLSSARMRWDVHSAPSPPPRWNSEAPGMPTWRAELFRSRSHLPGTWILRDDGSSLVADPAPAFQSPAAPHPGDLAATAGDRSLAAG